MKTIEELDEEYKIFKPKIQIKTKEDLEIYIEVGLMDVGENLNSIKIDYNDNKKNKLITKLKNFFLFTDDDTSFYDEDLKLLDEIVLLNLIYENYFQTILIYTDDDNCSELGKLLDFLTIYYEKNVQYVESKRDNLEYRQNGYSCINYRDEDYFMLVNQFFEKKLKEITGVKPVEKRKEI